MRKGFALLVCVLGIAGSASAGGVDKAKVRELLHLPESHVTFGFCFDGFGGFFLPSDIDELPDQIAALQQALSADATNAEQWSQLSELCWRAGRTELAKEAKAKAEALFRERVAAAPEDGFTLARLSEALPAAEHAEAEKLLNRSLGLAPRDWRCWRARGRYLLSRGVSTLLGPKAETQSLDFNGLISLIKETRPGPEQTAAAQKLFDEARECHQRAIALAPHEPQVYIERAEVAYYRAVLHYASSLAQNDLGDFNGLASPEIAADVQKAAQLSTGDYRALGAGVLFELMVLAAKNPGAYAKEDQKVMDLLPADTRERTQAALQRLEGYAASKDPVVAAGALETLGILKFILYNDPADGARIFRRAVILRPCRAFSWNMLIAMLARTEDEKATLAACKEWVEKQDCLQSRMMLAKSYEHLNDPGTAEEQIRLAIRQGPRNFEATFSLAVILLKYGTKEAALDEAGGLLANLERSLGENPSPEWKANYVVLQSAYLALTDHPHEACVLLRDYLPKAHQFPEPVQLMKILLGE
jgi:tetratricopeptide (TPR) repeat protein